MKKELRLPKPESELSLQNELFGFSLFTDAPEPLRSYNRAIIIQNLVAREEPEKAHEYLSTFNDRERLAIMAIQMKINAEGKDAVHQYILSNINWDEVA